MNWFTWSKEENDWVVSEYHYNEEFKNWQGPIHNDQLLLHTLKENRKKEQTYTEYAGSAKFIGITREVNPAIPINYYKDQFREHIIINIM